MSYSKHIDFDNLQGTIIQAKTPIFISSLFVLTLCIVDISAQVHMYADTNVSELSDHSIDSLMNLSIEELMTMKVTKLKNTGVTTLSRYVEKKDLAPGTIHSFDARMIKNRGYRNLTDLLLSIPGFTVFLKGTGIVAGVRGLNAVDNEKVTLLINGRESNNLQEPEFLNGPINLQNLERVEVVVGPSSFFQRANTLAATINLITKKIDGIEVSASTGSATTYSATTLIGKKWNNGSFVSASFIIERKDGYNAWDSLNRSGLENTTLTGRLDPSIFATLEGEYGNFWGQAIVYQSNFPELNLNTKGNDGTYKDHMYLANLIHTLHFNKNLVIKTSFDVGHKSTQRLNNDGPTINNALEVKYSQIDYSGELALNYIGIEDHRFETGVQWAYEDNQEYYSTFNNVYTTLVSEDNNTQAIGFYLYDNWQIFNNYSINGGVRIDYNSILSETNEDVQWGARIANIYQPSDKWVSKIIANRTIRFPSGIAALNEAWGSDKPEAPNFASKNLRAQNPENLTTIEWQNIIYFQFSRLSSNVYYQSLKNFITWIGPHTNAGDYAGYGIELEYLHIISNDIQIWTNAAYVDSDFEANAPPGTISEGTGGGSLAISDDNKILGSPSYTANLGVDYEVTNNLTLTSQLRYFTKQAAYSKEQERFKEIHNRYYIDATATYRSLIIDDLDISISGKNLLDDTRQVATQWRKSRNHPRGRTFLATIQISF